MCADRPTTWGLQMPSTDQMKAAVQAYTAAHTAGDIDGIAALFAEDAVLADPVDQPTRVGRAVIREFFAGTHEGTQGFELSITGPIRAVGSWAAVPLRAVTRIGDSTFTVEIIDVFTFDDDGLFSDMKAFWTAADIQVS